MILNPVHSLTVGGFRITCLSLVGIRLQSIWYFDRLEFVPMCREPKVSGFHNWFLARSCIDPCIQLRSTPCFLRVVTCVLVSLGTYYQTREWSNLLQGSGLDQEFQVSETIIGIPWLAGSWWNSMNRKDVGGERQHILDRQERQHTFGQMCVVAISLDDRQARDLPASEYSWP